MEVQLIIIALFVLNMASIWSTVFLRKCEWYRIPGSFVFAYLPLLTVFFEQPRFELDFFWWRIVGAAAIFLGVGLVVWAKTAFGKAVTSLGDKPANLVTSGPYRYVRHPMYLGFVFIYVGWWWVWAAVYAFYFGMAFLVLTWIEAYLEEKLLLEKQFGDQYREYKRHTGMFWIK